MENVTTKGFVYWRCYQMLTSYNIWPVPGGVLDQPAKFIKAINFCDTVLSVLRRDEAEKKRIKDELYRKSLKNG